MLSLDLYHGTIFQRNIEQNGGDEEKYTVRENPGQLDVSLKAEPEQKQMKDMVITFSQISCLSQFCFFVKCL